MYQALCSSEFTFDFHKPLTVEALERFDPQLILVFNRRWDVFQIMREIPRAESYWIDGIGNVGWIGRSAVYVDDWMAGLLGRDDPEPLIERLYWSDTKRHPDLEAARARKIIENRKKAEEKTREEYRHAFKDNKRLLLKAWEPVFNFPTLVN